MRAQVIYMEQEEETEKINIIFKNREEGRLYVCSKALFAGSRAETIYYDRMVKVEGLGRWIWCKYCKKSVQPWLGAINQATCPECNYGLTPDFYKFENLQRYLETGDLDIMDEDLKSPEAKAWHEKSRINSDDDKSFVFLADLKIVKRQE